MGFWYKIQRGFNRRETQRLQQQKEMDFLRLKVDSVFSGGVW